MNNIKIIQMNIRKVCILTGEDGTVSDNWLQACNKYEVKSMIVDIRNEDWIEAVKNASYILAAPPGNLSYLKQYYDECLTIAAQEIKIPVYPSLTELLMYENKRMQSLWMRARDIPHPDTHVYYDKNAALNFINNSGYPIVAKSNIGAAGSGVRILKSKGQAQKYIKLAFSKNGVSRRYGPNFRQRNKLKRYFGALLRPSLFIEKFNSYNKSYEDRQKWFVIFQEYIPHDFEWRVVRIGESYFAHKKLKSGDKASGSKNKEYLNPPLRLLDFVREICEKNNLRSQAVDIFETPDGRLLVNELQTIFGQSDPYQMLVNGMPGRYIHDGNAWLFEEGDFTTNECFDIRLRDVLLMFDKYYPITK